MAANLAATGARRKGWMLCRGEAKLCDRLNGAITLFVTMATYCPAIPMKHETRSFEAALDEAPDARAGWAAWRRLGAIAAAFVVAHAIGILVLPDAARSMSLVFLIAAPTVAAAACAFRAARDDRAEGWIALAVALSLWAAGMAATAFFAEASGVGALSMLLYVLYGVPIIYLAASPRSESPHIRIIDGVLSLLLGYLFFVHTFAFTTMKGADATGVAGLRLMFDVENIALAGFAAIQFAISRDHARRSLFFALAVFTATYLVSAAYINHLEANSDYGRLIDLVIDAPFLILAVLASGPVAVPRWPSTSRRVATLIDAGSPLMLALMLVAVSILCLSRAQGLAIAGLVVASLGLGIRNMLAQARVTAQADWLDTLARRDALTGLANRREFDAVLGYECARQGEAEPIALLMIDVDHFKAVNDSLGHRTGDERLRMVGIALASCATMRGSLIARYGGEEFAAILPGASRGEAVAIGEAMRQAVANLQLASPCQRGHVTVSIGVTHFDQPHRPTADALVRAADAALYVAKHDGRDCVKTLPLAV
jgi:diguanylate cyclase (GGDEF)-like protein